MGLEKLYGLIDSGKIDELPGEVETLEGEERIEGEFWKINWLLNKTRDLDQARRQASALLSQQPVSTVSQIFQHFTKHSLFFYEGKHEELLSELEAIEKLLPTLPAGKKTKKEVIEALLLNATGHYHRHGTHNKALDFFSRALTIASAGTFPLKYLAPDIHFWAGQSHFDLGNWEPVLDLSEKSQRGFNELGNEYMEALALIGIGVYYREQGDLKTALEKFQRSLELGQKTGNKSRTISVMGHIGHIYRKKRELQRAVDWYQKSLNMAREDRTGMGYLIQFRALAGLIGVSLDLQNTEQVKRYLAELEEVHQAGVSVHHYVEIYYQLTKARVLKAGRQFREKVQAGNMLRNLLENFKLDQIDRYRILLELCDLLIQEVQFQGDNAVYRELEDTFEQLKTLALDWNFASALIDVSILQAKLALVDGNARLAFKELERAQELAGEKGLGYLVKKVQKQQELVKTQLNQWQDLIDRNASLQERLKQADIESYIQVALREWGSRD